MTQISNLELLKGMMKLDKFINTSPHSLSKPIHDGITSHDAPHVTPQVEKLILTIGGDMTRQELQSRKVAINNTG